MENSAIEWTHHTFNPWIGCTKVSAGCANCYAETLMDTRYGRVKWGKGHPRQRTSVTYWKHPRKWNMEPTRRRVFCASLADVFDEEVADEWRDDLFSLIYDCQNIDWLVLTKRPKKALDYLLGTSGAGANHFESTFKNVWLGVSVENQEQAQKRIPILMQIPAKVRFLSVEPQLGPVDLAAVDALASQPWPALHWVICGGESGKGKRLFNEDWARLLRDQCSQSGIAFFMKQIDKVKPIPADLMIREFPL